MLKNLGRFDIGPRSPASVDVTRPEFRAFDVNKNLTAFGIQFNWQKHKQPCISFFDRGPLPGSVRLDRSEKSTRTPERQCPWPSTLVLDISCIFLVPTPSSDSPLFCAIETRCLHYRLIFCVKTSSRRLATAIGTLQPDGCHSRLSSSSISQATPCFPPGFVRVANGDVLNGRSLLSILGLQTYASCK